MTRKVAVMTGGSADIGARLVAGYRRRGWTVVSSAHAIEPSEDPDLLVVPADMSERVTADRTIDAALERFRRIDTLINNAGVSISKPFTDYSAADYAAVVGVNLATFFWFTQRAIDEVVSASRSSASRASSTSPARAAASTSSGMAHMDIHGFRVFEVACCAADAASLYRARPLYRTAAVQ
jgi:NAD(P)-dependent dehydrogenase (short-subunit alcohol dehydrogenase family)